MRIQDSSLDEPAIRLLNDEINQLVRRVKQWNARLLALGYAKREPMGEDELSEATGNINGYYYFGRAKELPDAKELLSQQQQEPTEMVLKLPLSPSSTESSPARTTTLAPRVKRILEEGDEEYYGNVMGTDDERTLRQKEAAIEASLRNNPVGLDWITNLPVRLPRFSAPDVPLIIPPDRAPDQAQIEQYMIERKRRELLAKYTQSLSAAPHHDQ
jgi:pre-mRNA-splicing factor ISY1